MAEHEAINPNVPSVEVDSPREFLVAKRPGVGRGVILVIDGQAVEFSGDPWSAFQTHFYGALSNHSMEDYEEGTDLKYPVAYDFADGYFLGQELVAVKDFVDEHNLR